MAFHHLYHGGGQTPFTTLFPQNAQDWTSGEYCGDCRAAIDPNAELTADILDTIRTGIAAHKAPSDFGLSRTFDFYPDIQNYGYRLADGTNCLIPNDQGGRAQVGLLQYIKCNPIVSDDTIYPAVIPQHTFLKGIAWKVEVPEDGASFELSLLRAGTSIGTVDGSSESSGWIDVNTWQDRSEAIVAKVTAWPARGARELRITFSAALTDPFTGN